MKACVYAQKDKVALREVPLEELKKGTIRVKVNYCAICATDEHVVRHGLFNCDPGIVLGHEVSGTVVELGPDTENSGFKVGDRVVGTPLRNCGQCYYCRTGRPMYCTAYSDMVFGGMAEYKVYTQNCLFKIPDELPMEKAALVEPLTCVMRAMDLANIRQGDLVCLSGLGGIGLLMLQAIKLKGAGKIAVIEPIKEKREVALKLGADFAIDPVNESVVEVAEKITDGRGFNVVVECSGARSAAPVCIDIAAKCGTVVYFAVYPTDYEMPLNLFNCYCKELRIQTVYTHTEIVPRAIELISKLELDDIIGKVYPLEECETAFDAFATKKYPKVLIQCSKEP